MCLCGHWDNFPPKPGRKAAAVAQAEGSSAGGASTTKGRGKNNYQVFVVIHLLQG